MLLFFLFFFFSFLLALGAIAYFQDAYYVSTEDSIPTLINDLNCTGSERSILNCSFNSLTDYSCNTHGGAALLCQSKLQ